MPVDLKVYSELEKLVDAYVDTYRRLLNGSTADERLTSLAEDPGKLVSLAAHIGNALVNGSLGYYDGFHRLRREFSALFEKLHTLYEGLPTYLDFWTASSVAHRRYCPGNEPCFARTQDNFDILTEHTGSILNRVAAPFKHLLSYYGDTGVQYDLESASKEQPTDRRARNIANACAWQYDSPGDHVCDGTAECVLRAVNRIVGPTCEETDNATLMEFYDCRRYKPDCEEWNLTSAASNRCFHIALMRYSNYSTRVYESFIESLETYLLMELDGFGFCRHIVEMKKPIANFTERREEVSKLVQGIATQLLRGKKILEDDGAGKSKTWTELARPVVHAGIDVVANGSDFPYPSSDRAVEKYQIVGETIIDAIHGNKFNAETYRYEVIVYKPGSDAEEHCLMNLNDDVVQDNYKNVNFLVSRTDSILMSALSSEGFRQERQERRIEEDNAKIRACLDSALDKLVDAYVDTYRRLLNGSAINERLASLAEDPGSFASLAESLGAALVNGSLGYYNETYEEVFLRLDYSQLFESYTLSMVTNMNINTF